MKKILTIGGVLLLSAFTATAQDGSTCLPQNAKIFIHDMNDGFHTFITAALIDTKTPVLIVTDREKADFEMTGSASESKRNSWARVIFAGQTGSKESASVAISNIHNGVVVFSTASDRSNARRGKRSVAQKIAREIRGEIKTKAKQGCKL